MAGGDLMARGKHGIAAANRRNRELEDRVRELEAALEKLRNEAREAEVAHSAELQRRAGDAARRTAEHVQDLIGSKVEDLSSALSTAVWCGQRLAMTEHLTWLFLKGFVTWDRLAGDREVLRFLLAHGDLDAWFALTAKYAHRFNHQDRRRSARIPGVKRMLQVLAGIARAEGGDVKAWKDREALDAVVEAARTSVINVELREVLTENGWLRREPTQSEIDIHATVLDAVEEFREISDRVVVNRPPVAVAR